MLASFFLFFQSFYRKRKLCGHRCQIFGQNIHVTTKREPFKKEIYQCLQQTTKGTACDSKLGSCFILFSCTSWGFPSEKLLLCVPAGLFSCNLRDWFLMKYKAADRHLQTRRKPKIPLPPLQKPFNTQPTGAWAYFSIFNGDDTECQNCCCIYCMTDGKKKPFFLLFMVIRTPRRICLSPKT